MVPEDSQAFQAPPGMMDGLVFQAQRDPRGCLASPVFRGKEESLAQTDVLAVRGTRERTVGLASLESRG